jgi:hypothetical protein
MLDPSSPGGLVESELVPPQKKMMVFNVYHHVSSFSQLKVP